MTSVSDNRNASFCSVDVASFLQELGRMADDGGQLKLALGREEAAKALSLKQRHFDALNSSGKIPRPIKLGNRPIWVVDTLKRWLIAGAPQRDVWEEISKC